MLALGEYEDGVCGGCGFHSSIADEDPYFALEEKVCPVCAQTQAEIRARDEREKELAEKGVPRLPSDGRTRYLRLLAPEEAESVAEKAPGN